MPLIAVLRLRWGNHEFEALPGIQEGTLSQKQMQKHQTTTIIATAAAIKQHF